MSYRNVSKLGSYSNKTKNLCKEITKCMTLRETLRGVATWQWMCDEQHSLSSRHSLFPVPTSTLTWGDHVWTWGYIDICNCVLQFKYRSLKSKVEEMSLCMLVAVYAKCKFQELYMMYMCCPGIVLLFGPEYLTCTAIYWALVYAFMHMEK